MQKAKVYHSTLAIGHKHWTAMRYLHSDKLERKIPYQLLMLG